MPDGSDDDRVTPRRREILTHPAFAYFWSATTLRSFGGAIAGIAFQFLIVTVLNATLIQISVLSALAFVGSTRNSSSNARSASAASAAAVGPSWARARSARPMRK